MTTTEITRLLKSRQTPDRLKALRAIEASEDPAHVPLLLETLDDPTALVAEQAAKVLGELAAPEDAPRILAAFERALSKETSAAFTIASHLAYALGRLEYGPARAALKRSIRARVLHTELDPAIPLRGNSALALSALGGPDAFLEVSLLLFEKYDFPDGHNRIPVEPRRSAAEALGRFADPTALVPLALKLTLEDAEQPEVLEACMAAVAALEEDERTLELLAPFLDHKDPSLVVHAALLLAQTNAPEAASLLSGIIPSLTGNALRAVVLALSTLRSDAGQTALHALAFAANPAVRLALVESLSGARDSAARSVLRRLAETDAAPNVRAAAQKTLDGGTG